VTDGDITSEREMCEWFMAIDGTSGSPWLEGSTVTGLIGEPYGGGCEGQITNYSPLLTTPSNGY